MEKLIVIGDPHFKTSNVPDTDEFIEKIYNLAQDTQPDRIIILGDLLHEHERLHTIPLNKAYEFVKKMAMISNTYILVGNHDMINNQQFLNSNHWMNAMKKWDNVTIIDTPTIIHINQDNFYTMCPYVPNGRFQEALDTIDTLDWHHSTLIFAHQEFYGCKMGAIISSDGDQWDKSFPMVISGHIHSNQKLLDGHIYYPGSAMQHAFGDPKCIISIITVNETNYTNQEIDLNLRKKRIVYHDLDNIDNLDIETLGNKHDDIKLTLSGNYNDFKVFKSSDLYKEIINLGIHVVHKNKKQTTTNMDKLDEVMSNVLKQTDNCLSTEHSVDDSVEHSDACKRSEYSIDDSAEQNVQHMCSNLPDFENLVEFLVFDTKDTKLISDFNYIFKNDQQDNDIILL
jgi:DNA repair exonuclease SbcCD nuclease subunit